MKSYVNHSIKRDNDGENMNSQRQIPPHASNQNRGQLTFKKQALPILSKSTPSLQDRTTWVCPLLGNDNASTSLRAPSRLVYGQSKPSVMGVCPARSPHLIDQNY